LVEETSLLREDHLLFLSQLQTLAEWDSNSQR